MRKLNDPEVLYVVGRDKSLRHLNGKSANLNHCLGLLYPDVKDPSDDAEMLKIPVNELVCIFDADQTCSRGFWQVRRRRRNSEQTTKTYAMPEKNPLAQFVCSQLCRHRHLVVQCVAETEVPVERLGCHVKMFRVLFVQRTRLQRCGKRV